MNKTSKQLAQLPFPGEYARAWRTLKALPDDTLVNWTWLGPKPAAELREEFTAAMMKRINERGGEQWRNVEMMNDVNARRDQRDVRAHVNDRVIVRQFRTKWARKRFAHHIFVDDFATA